MASIRWIALAVMMSVAVADGLSGVSRRQLCQRLGGLAAVSALQPALAANRVYGKEDASAAVGRIRVARATLDQVSTAIASKSFDDAQALLESPPITGFEKDCTILVQSTVLASEDKIAIGTIRRYGVGADVSIMIGGLANAVSESNARGAADYAVKAKAALDELLVIVRPYKL